MSVGIRYIVPYETALDAEGVSLPGAKLYFYQTGTATPLNTYSDVSLTIPNTNPVIADAGGLFGNIFLLPRDYKVVLKDADGNELWTADPVSSNISSVQSIQSIDNIEGLRAFAVTPSFVGSVLYVRGYYTDDDGGEGFFTVTDSNPGVDNGGTIIWSDITGFYYQRSTSTSILIPEQWGALNNGTDPGGVSTTAWANMAAFLNAQNGNLGGGTIQCGQGTYRVSKTLSNPTFNTPVIVRGSGMSATRITAATGERVFVWDGTGVTNFFGGGIFDCQLQTDNVADAAVLVRNAQGWSTYRTRYFDGNGSSSTTIYGIFADGTSFNLDIAFCRFELGTAGMVYFTHRTVGLEEIGPNSSDVHDNDFAPINGGIAIFGDTTQNYRVRNNRIEWASPFGGTGIALVNCKNATIIGNDLSANVGASAAAQVSLTGDCSGTVVTSNVGFVSAGMGIVVNSGGVRVSENFLTMEGAATWGIKNNGRSNVSIDSNTITVTHAVTGCIWLASGSDGSSASNNSIYGNPSSALTCKGILVDDSTLVIRVNDNLIDGITYGIDLQSTSGSKNTTCLGNTVKNFTTASLNIVSAGAVFGDNTTNNVS